MSEPVAVLSRIGSLCEENDLPGWMTVDELDPIVRRDTLGAVIRTIADEGRTVLFSSHLLDEVEQVADHVTMISQGQVALSAPLHVVKQSHRCVTVRFPEPRPRPPDVVGVLRWDGAGQEWTAVCGDGSSELQKAAAGWGAQVVAERTPTLDELFFAHVGHAASEADG